MDETCTWLKMLIQWVDQRPESPIHFAGMGSTFANRPAALVELIYLTEGAISQLEMGSARTALKQGQAGLFNVHFGNIAPQPDPFRGWCVFLDVSQDTRFGVLERTPLALVADVRDHGRVERAFENVIQRCRALQWGGSAYQPASKVSQRQTDVAAQALLKAVLLELLGTLLQEVNQSAAAGPAAGLPEGIDRAAALIHRDYHLPDLDRHALAKAASMHPDHFTRAFGQCLSMTPMRYLTKVRLEQAAFLLTHTDHRISDIAHQVGYEDPLHFSRLFRSHRVKSPRDYRMVTRQAD